MNEKHLCDYGCGREAIIQFKNGKWCCNEDYRKCIALSKKRGNNIKINWKNKSEEEIEKFKEKQRQITLNKWKDPNSKLGSLEHLDKISKSSKKNWTNLEFRENQIKSIKEAWIKKPELKENLINRNKKSWKNGTFSTKQYRLNLKIGIKKGWENNDDRKKLISKIIKENWKKINTKMNSEHLIENGKKYWKNKENRKLQKIKQTKIWKNIERRQLQKIKQIKIWKKLLKDPVFVKKFSKSKIIKPNKPEILIMNILNSMFPGEWNYIGDFSFWIGRKNPDFINYKKKKVIEHFGTYYHGKEFTGIDNKIHEQKRINYFEKLGYSTLIIWENELKNTEQLINKINKFNFEKLIYLTGSNERKKCQDY